MVPAKLRIIRNQKELYSRIVNIQSLLLFYTLIPTFSRRAKEILRGPLNIYPELCSLFSFQGSIHIWYKLVNSMIVEARE